MSRYHFSLDMPLRFAYIEYVEAAMSNSTEIAQARAEKALESLEALRDEAVGIEKENMDAGDLALRVQESEQEWKALAHEASAAASDAYSAAEAGAPEAWTTTDPAAAAERSARTERSMKALALHAAWAGTTNSRARAALARIAGILESRAWARSKNYKPQA